MIKIFSQKITLDDIKVKNKLILMYVLSVLIPVLTTNFIFYSNFNKSIKQQQTIFLRETLQRVNINVMGEIRDCIHATDTFFLNNKLNILLSKPYKNHNDYYRVYNSDLKDCMDMYDQLYGQIYEMNVYASNPSIIDGGGYNYIDSVIKSSVWYRDAVSSHNNIFIDAYIDKNTYDTTQKDTVRYFSIIRQLDNLAYGSVVRKLIKVDIDYNYMNKIINNESPGSDIFIVNRHNDIIFSNKRSYSSFTHDFVSFDNYKQKPDTIMRSQKMSGVLKDYKLIIVVPKTLVMDKMENANVYLMILILINLVFPSIIILLISRSVKNRLETLSCHMKNINHDKFVLSLVECREGKDEIGQLIGEFNLMSTRIDELIKDVYEASIQQKNLEIAKKQAELNALQSQINPHFLFNTLETIRMRSLLKKEMETSDIIKNLSKMLRRSLNWKDDLVKISEEVEFTMEFLKIEKYRFEDKLSYSIRVDDSVKNCRIPKLSIMTLVENACVHGIENIARAGTVEVSIWGIEDRIKISIKDNGIGMTEARVNNLMEYLKSKQEGEDNNSFEGIGIKNVYRRLEMFYGNKFRFSIESKENNGTDIEIQIPYDNLCLKRNEI